MEAYRVGPSTIRPMGATNIPKRGTRRGYTLEDDQILWDWVEGCAREQNLPRFGEKVYKLLEREVHAIAHGIDACSRVH